jgi:hypothetical protein
MQTELKCETCGGTIETNYVGRPRTRFCCPSCKWKWFQKERREAIEFYRASQRSNSVGDAA